MTETTEKNSEKRGEAARKPMSLKGKVSQGTVRQSFSHGRTKTVVVETKRKRAPAAGEGLQSWAKEPAPAAAKPAPVPVPVPAKAPEPPAPASVKGQVLRTLTEDERALRVRALEDARVADAEARKRAEIEARARAEEEARLKVVRDEEAAREAAEAALRPKPVAAPVVEARAKPAPVAPPPVFDPNDLSPTERIPVRTPRVDDEEEEETSRAKKGLRPGAVPKKPPANRNEPKRRSGKLTITRALIEGDEERVRSLASVKRARERERLQAMARTEPQKIVREVVIPEAITVQELAQRMAIRSADVIKVLMGQGLMLTINDVLDTDTAQLVAEEYGHTVKRISEADVEEGLVSDEDADETRAPRPPVVTIMGHVDHGKTSLLDAIRHANVAAGEAGGITQHIGAYQVSAKNGSKITFVDTPGHAAFTAMRARGAKVTDIVVLVVAADDGVMPQTVEALNHAKAAGVPIIIAINKIDKPDANPDKVRQGLLQHEIVVESLGGETQEVLVSATKKTGLDKLEDAILLQAEILELTANPDRPAEGTVIEAELDKGRGPVATVLVQKGTLRQGDIFVAGPEWGRVRAIVSDRGEQIKEATPSMPVEVLGLSGMPGAGDNFIVVETEARAREVSDYRQRTKRDARNRLAGPGRGSLEQMMKDAKSGGIKDVPIVIKGDVQGSLEAIIGALEQLGTSEVRVRVLHGAVGGVSESDVILAVASGAPIIAFNVRAEKQARDMAERDKIEIRYYSIIYNLVDDIKAVMSGLLAPTIKETFLGNAEILEVFNISKIGKVAGCRVTEGQVRRGARVRLIRDNVVIHAGKLSTLKRFKDEVREVQTGQECGMGFENYHDLQKGDVIECFDVEEIKRSL
jgi:translation initiation factor IF-2